MGNKYELQQIIEGSKKLKDFFVENNIDPLLSLAVCSNFISDIASIICSDRDFGELIRCTMEDFLNKKQNDKENS